MAITYSPSLARVQSIILGTLLAGSCSSVPSSYLPSSPAPTPNHAAARVAKSSTDNQGLAQKGEQEQGTVVYNGLDDLHAMQDVIEGYAKAIGEGNVDQIMHLQSDQYPILSPSGSGYVSGKKDLRAYWTKHAGKTIRSLKLKTSTAGSMGSIHSYERGTYEAMEVAPGASEAHKVKGTYLMLLVDEGKMKWRVSTLFLNANQED